MKINRVLVKKRIDFQNCSIILLVHVYYNSDLSFISSAPYRKTFCEQQCFELRDPQNRYFYQNLNFNFSQSLYFIVFENVKKFRVSFNKRENLDFAYLNATFLVWEVELQNFNWSNFKVLPIGCKQVIKYNSSSFFRY